MLRRAEASQRALLAAARFDARARLVRATRCHWSHKDSRGTQGRSYRNLIKPGFCPNRTAAMPIVSRTSEIGCRVPRTHFLRHERAQRLSRVSARRIAKPLAESPREMRIFAEAASVGDLAERLAGAR